MSLIIIVFILVMQFMSLYMYEIFGKGLGGWVIFQLFIYAAGRIVITAMPIAILAGALMAFGSMGEHYELAAIKACGISLFKAMRSVIIFSGLLMAFSFWFSFNVVPRANLKFFSLFYDVQQKKPNLAIKPGYFYSDIDGYVIRVADKDNEKDKLYDVMIWDHTEGRGAVNVVMADSARTFLDERDKALRMVLYHGSRYEEYKPESGEPNKLSLGRTYFDSSYYQFKLKGFELSRTDEKQFRHQIILPRKELSLAIDSLVELEVESRMKYLAQLGRYNRIDTTFLDYEPDSLYWGTYASQLHMDDRFANCFRDKHSISDLISSANIDLRAINSYLEFMVKRNADEAKTYRKYKYEFYLRHTLPINCLLFMLIGTSLGAIIRKGGLGVPAIISIVLFIFFYILITQGKKLAQEGAMEPWAGAALPIFVFAPIAVVVTIQATVDAKVFDESTWEMIKDAIRARAARLSQMWFRKS